MKKLLFACAGLVLISSANAQSGADVKINGELRARHTAVENAEAQKRSWDSQTEQRTKIGIHFTKSEDLMAHVTLLAAGTWGNEGTSNKSGELEPDTEAQVKVYEAWAFWKAMDNFSLRVGRGVLDVADGTVISKNDFMNVPYSFEGALGTYYHEMFNLNVFTVKGMHDVYADNTKSALINFYGFSADLKVAPEYFKIFNIHALQSKASGIDSSSIPVVGGPDTKDERLRLGVTLAGDHSGVDYRATYAIQTGEVNFVTGSTKVDSDASMMDLEVGYTLKDVMNLRVAALYHSDTGDKSGASKNERYDSFFYDFHNNAGKMDVVGWGNSTYIKLGATIEPVEMLVAGLDYYMFTKTETNDGIYKPGKLGAYTTTGASGDDVGTEIDLWVKKTLSNGAELMARYGMFSADDAWGTGKEDISDIQLTATFRF